MTNLPAIRDVDPIALGDVMHKSGMFPDTKDAAQAVVKILAGQEYGLGPVAAMSGIHVIDKKPVPGATVLAGCVKRSQRYDYFIKRLDEQECSLVFVDRSVKATTEIGDRTVPGLLLGESTFTTEDAKRAGLLGRTNWQKYPRNMRFARALSNGVRWFCSDVTQTGVVLTAEEVADDVDLDVGTFSVGLKEQAEPKQIAASTEPAEGTISNEQVRELNELYQASGWRDANEADPHKLLRWQLLAVDVPNAEKAPIPDLIASMNAKQFETVKLALEDAVNERSADE